MIDGAFKRLSSHLRSFGKGLLLVMAELKLKMRLLIQYGWLVMVLILKAGLKQI
jgi:hypothetical protein